MNAAAAYVLSPLAAFVLSLAAVKYMLAHGAGLAADVPNARSMHERVVPRGGGVAFVTATVAVALASQLVLFPGAAPVWYIAPFAAMAALGWVDDRRGLGISVRLAVQLAAAGFSAWLMFGSGAVGAGALVLFAAVVIVMVWVTNLYNFMDGMDGLAASQAVIVFTTFGLWLAFRGAGAAASFCFITAAATLAFLLVNWHPARVFMGDTGSLALGMAIAAVAFDGMINHGIAPAAFAIVMGVFLFDATFTLLRRMLGGERWWRPHRSHLYQRAQALGFSQRGIVGAVISIDVVLASLASLLAFGRTSALAASVAAALLLVAPAVWITRRERCAATPSVTS